MMDILLNGRINLEKQIKTKILYALQFKCTRQNEYRIFNAETEGFGEDLFYSCKFGYDKANAHLLALGTEGAKVLIQDTNKVENPFVLVEAVHTNAVFDVTWVPRSNGILTASADGTVKLWTLREDASLEFQLQFRGHKKSIRALGCNQWDPAVFVSGCRDSNICIWDLRCSPYLVNEIQSAHLHRHTKGTVPTSNAITNLIFSDKNTLISSASTDGVINVWDLRKTYKGSHKEPQPVNMIKYAGSSSLQGYSSLSLSPHFDVLYASCLDSCIYSYHISNFSKPYAIYTGHENKHFYNKSCLSPCGSYLLSSSSDKKAYIWLTDGAQNNHKPVQPICMFSEHTDEVTCVAWGATDRSKIVTCSDDAIVRIFKTAPTDMECSESNDVILSSTPVYSADNTYLNFNKVRKNPFEDLQNQLDNLCDLPFNEPNRTPIRYSTTKTPQSSKRNILNWLSSKKTPKQLDMTPPLSCQKVDLSRRRLTDQLGENLHEEHAKIPLSPKTNVLMPTENLVRSAVKSLKYDDDKPGPSKCFTPYKVLHQTPIKSSNVTSPRRLDSPTADLPNFVVDGRSPHNRPEPKVTRKRQMDWLTSLTSQKKAKLEISKPKVLTIKKRKRKL